MLPRKPKMLLTLLVIAVGLVAGGFVGSGDVRADVASACQGKTGAAYTACARGYNGAKDKKDPGVACPFNSSNHTSCEAGYTKYIQENASTLAPIPSGPPGSVSAQGSSSGSGSSSAAAASGGCPAGTFLSFPTWYKYLTVQPPDCAPQLNELNDIWAIGFAIVEILLRLVMYVSIGFVLYGGFKYIIARGNPDKSASAKNTVSDALVGLIIALVATAVVTFVGTRFS